ncbi:MAG: putative protein phosphatase [Parcubacteria group bacterium]|nr:putative protein phosphatase [Parcubacteria group bacterium]
MSTVSRASEQGGRDAQEDRAVFIKLDGELRRGWILALMDGHGGKEVAEVCSEDIDELVSRFAQKEGTTENMLRLIVEELNRRTEHCNAGSTLSIACILEDKDEVTLAVLGDSPIVIVDNKGRIHRGPIHNISSNKAELEAAEARGAERDGRYIFFGNSGLQMSRSLGDRSLGPILSREPEIQTVKNPRWVMVCTDGVIDSCDEDAEGFIKGLRRQRKTLDAEKILKRRARKPLPDNATVLLWKSFLPNAET